MNPTELRALAEALAEYAESPDRVSYQADPILRAADYLLACADEKPVGMLSVSTFRGHLENRDFDYTGSLPDGDYPLYTHPAPAAPQAEPKREPLSEKQIDAIHELWYERAGMSFADVVRAVERAHGITGDSDACR